MTLPVFGVKPTKPFELPEDSIRCPWEDFVEFGVAFEAWSVEREYGGTLAATADLPAVRGRCLCYVNDDRSIVLLASTPKHFTWDATVDGRLWPVNFIAPRQAARLIISNIRGQQDVLDEFESIPDEDE